MQNEVMTKIVNFMSINRIPIARKSIKFLFNFNFNSNVLAKVW